MKKIINCKQAFSIISALSILTLFSYFLAPTVFAQQKLPMTVGPARQEITADPGQKEFVKIRFYNQGDEPLSGILRVADFLVTDSAGSPLILDEASMGSPKYSGSSWVSLPYDRITIAPTDMVEVIANITVPQSAKAGGRYVAVYFEPGGNAPGGTQGAGSGVSARIASLLYIKVNGNIKEHAVITRFFAPSFFEYGPLTLETEILNRGDYHIRPRGVVALTDAFGALVDQVSLKEQNVFPDASLIYKNEVGKKWLFGKYKIHLMSSYGNGQILDSSVYVWVIPWKIIAIVLLAILILWTIIKKLIDSSKNQVSMLENKLSKEEEEIEILKKALKDRK